MIIWHVETSSGPRFDWATDEEHLRQQLIEYNNDVLNDGEPDDQLAEDVTLEEAIEKIEERENFSREDFPLPKVYVVVIDSDSGGTSTDVFDSYRKALEFVCNDSGIDHAGKSDEQLRDELEAHFENSEDWYVLNEEKIQ